ncbi:MAG: GTP cyclohydrolase [Actinomycetota bacterium]|nr:GTP cyclohydrolase [Actinomycetota bacterium]
MIEHYLDTELLGDVTVLVPEDWTLNLGFILRCDPLVEVPLVRIQSRCAYGEVFGSRHCDCGAQLRRAASMIREGGGLVVYLEQEGRGAGVAAKAAAYRANERELIDTFSHYESTGLPPDLRSYDHAADALLAMGVRSVRLLTNNPNKVEGLRARGLDVERLQLIVDTDPAAEPYLAAKRNRGHLL